jgi:acetyl-CoA C-acetyltransferase
MGDYKMIDTMIKDGLWDAFNGYHMGTTAENVAEQWQITREQQDQFAVASQNKAEAAQKAGKFKDEIAPVTIKTRKGDIVVEDDEYIRTAPQSRACRSCARPSPRKARSRPAMPPASMTVPQPWSCYECCGSEKSVASSRWRDRVLGHAGVDPAIMGTGPIPASRKALEKAGWTARNSIWWKPTKPSLRRPARSTRTWAGTRTSSTSMAVPSRSVTRSARRCPRSLHLLHEMQRRDAKKGLATLCIGGGMGVAEMCVERALP